MQEKIYKKTYRNEFRKILRKSPTVKISSTKNKNINKVMNYNFAITLHLTISPSGEGVRFC